jgi:hypothetical protein
LKRLCLQYGVLFILVAALSACSTKVAVNPVEGTTSVKLKNAQKVYIARANDGRYADNVYSDSGSQVSNYVAQSIASHTSETIVANQVSPLETNMQNAENFGAKYLFIPEITHWEPRAAAWSGRPTRVHITLTVYDVETREKIAAKSLSVRGRIATLVSQHAHELAEETVKELVNSFY